MFGALAGSREWLERILGLPSDEARELEGRLRAARAAICSCSRAGCS